jgi:ABC-type branched-subunit amino acid transport system substrate-binding protein
MSTMFQALLLAALAQGVTDDRILIGMEGPANSFSVDEENLGMRLVIRQANESGGVHGRMLVEKAYPRGSDEPVGQAVRNAQRLVEQDGVFLLFNFGGPAAVRIGEYAMERDVPYLFPHTALLTVDGDRHIFTSYPRYDGESRMMLEFLVRDRQAKRIAVVHAPNIYGDYFAVRAATLADEIGYEFVGAQSLPIQPDQAISQLRALRDLDPDAVIMALYPAGARRVVEAKAALGWDVTLVSSGPLTDEQYLNVAGGQAEGTLGFCYYPDPNVSDAPGVADYRRLMAQYHPDHPLNRYSLYGYVFGQLVVEGLRRAGRDLTERAFLDAMESIRGWDSGGILPPVSFSSSDHHAQTAGFVCELRDARFEPLTGWISP